MKNLFRYAFALVAGALLLSACTDEYEYDAPAAYQGMYITSEQDSYFFLPNEDKTVTVKVVRPQGGAAETIALSSDNELFTVPESVTFEEGQTEAEFTVVCNIEAGQNETLNISLPEGTYDANYFSGAFELIASCEYVWEEAGSAEYQSSFWGLKKTVKVRHAQGSNVYELMDVFKAGYNIRFTLDDDYNALAITPTQQNMGFTNGTYGQVSIDFDTEYGCQFVNEGNKFAFTVYWFVAAGYFNGSSGPDPEYFTWTEGYPGE